MVLPEKIVDEFKVDEYDCFIFQEVIYVRASLKDYKLIIFLKSLKNYHDFIIGAICGITIFLSLEGLLDNKNL